MRKNKTGEYSEKWFSEEELTLAAGLVRESILSTLPEPEACEHEFSPEFEA